ncbi:MAG: CoA transferase [Candidatus Lokiarchaeota archaeon]|nr:CoA transferase [Candidatus Lokiarchaeota archaeon]
MTLPLDNIRVVDLSRMLPGPYCSMILGDLGAEIIHIKNPNYSDYDIPVFYKENGKEINAFDSIIMRNKKSITLNFRLKKAREIFYKLIKKVDVVLESFRPGIAEKLGIDYKNLVNINKGIIYCSLTGFGQNGPYHNLAGHNLNYVGLSGILDMNRKREIYGDYDKERPPITPGSHSAATSGAFLAGIGILSAIIERERNPKKVGQYIDISMLDSAFSLIPILAAFNFSNNNNNNNNPLHGSAPYYQIYKTKDNKYLTIASFEQKFWVRLCEKLGRKDLESSQFVQNEEKEYLFNELQKEISKKTQKEWIEILTNKDTCVFPINNFNQACNDPQIKARNMIIEKIHSDIGKIKIINSPINLSRTPIKIRTLAPKLGEHTEEILKELNYTDEDILNFRKMNII